MRKLGPVIFAALLSVAAHAQSGGAGTELSTALHRGIGPFLLTCFSGGLVALLTPCVFPMIPVTISYFTKREKNVVAAAFVYCLGIISTFAIVGVGASVLFGAAGISRFAANPWVNLVMATIFIVLALNLFGLFELSIRLPGKLANASRTNQGLLIGPYFMGLAFSLTSFTCTAPIVGALLGLSAGTSGVLTPAVGMAAFGFAFSLPFLFLALFPSRLGRLPKSGQWLGAVKPALGFIELAAAVKFISNADLAFQWGLLKQPVFLAIWGVLALALGLYLLGVPRAVAKTGWVRRGLGVASIAGAAFLVMGMRGGDLGLVASFVPPNPYPSAVGTGSVAASGNSAEVKFLSKYDQAVAQAKQLHRNVFVDFTGVTCTNCRWMEQNVFVLSPVKSLLTQMVPVQLYTDRQTKEDDANQALQQKIGGTIALPVYVIITPEGKVLNKFEGKSQNSEEFVKFLKSGLDAQMALN